jgi:hypothetical protein
MQASPTIDGPAPERIRASTVARLLSLSVRGVQSMAARGEIPGAAKPGRIWTFDENRLRRWLREKEVEACRPTSTSGDPSGGREFKLPDATFDEAYAQAIGLKPGRGSRPGSSRSTGAAGVGNDTPGKRQSSSGPLRSGPD